MNSDDQPHVISGQHHGQRIASRVLEEHIQKAVRDGRHSMVAARFSPPAVTTYMPGTTRFSVNEG